MALVALASMLGMSSILLYPGDFSLIRCRLIPIVLSIALSLCTIPATITLWHSNFKNNLLVTSFTSMSVGSGSTSELMTGSSHTSMLNRYGSPMSGSPFAAGGAHVSGATKELLTHTRYIRIAPIVVVFVDVAISIAYGVLSFNGVVRNRSYSLHDPYDAEMTTTAGSMECSYDTGAPMSTVFLIIKCLFLTFSVFHARLSLFAENIEERRRTMWCRVTVTAAVTFAIICAVIGFNDGFLAAPISGVTARYVTFASIVSLTFIVFALCAFSAIVTTLNGFKKRKGGRHGHRSVVSDFGTLIINHRNDATFAKKLDKKLIANGVGNWFANRCCPNDDEELGIFQATVDAMSSPTISHIILVLSPSAIESRTCLRLVNEAYELEKNIQPVMCEHCYVERGAIRMMLLRKSIVDFAGESFSRAMHQLMLQLSSSMVADIDGSNDKDDDDDEYNSQRDHDQHHRANVESDNASSTRSNRAFARLYMGYRVGVAAFILVILSSIVIFILGKFSDRFTQSLASLATNLAGAIAALLYCVGELTEVFSSSSSNTASAAAASAAGDGSGGDRHGRGDRSGSIVALYDRLSLLRLKMTSFIHGSANSNAERVTTATTSNGGGVYADGRFTFQKKMLLHVLASALNIVSLAFKTTEVLSSDASARMDAISGAVVASDLVWTLLATAYNLITLGTLLQLNIPQFISLFKADVNGAGVIGRSGRDRSDSLKRTGSYGYGGATATQNQQRSAGSNNKRVSSTAVDGKELSKKLEELQQMQQQEAQVDEAGGADDELDRGAVREASEVELRIVTTKDGDGGGARGDDNTDGTAAAARASIGNSDNNDEVDGSGDEASGLTVRTTKSGNVPARTSRPAAQQHQQQLPVRSSGDVSTSASATGESSPATISSPKEIIEFIARERINKESAASKGAATTPDPPEQQSSFEKRRLSGLSTETTVATPPSAVATAPARAPDETANAAALLPSTLAATAMSAHEGTPAPAHVVSTTPAAMANTPVVTVGATPMPGATPAFTQVNTGSYGNTPNALRSLAMTPNGMATPSPGAGLGPTYDCFISYKHSDFGKAQILQNQLEKLGYKVQHIHHALQKSDHDLCPWTWR